MTRTLIIFGASGDLTRRKLIPALYELDASHRLPNELAIVGVSRTPLDDPMWRTRLEASARQAVSRFDPELWRRFARRLFYFSGDIDREPTFVELDAVLRKLETRFAPSAEKDSSPNERIFYLALPPDRYAETVRRLAAAGMTHPAGATCRVIVEKPFGRSAETARDLDDELHAALDESQIFRIDHYLGKETVNNIFVLRFANAVFEPVWNRRYVDHVQITAHESATVENRGAFYETAGVLRDMFQNHLLQLLAVTAMEPPKKFDADSIRDAKVRLLDEVRAEPDARRADSAVFGQYDGYRSEKNVAADSGVPTFAAMKLWIDNARWNGVPFYLRSGKGMSCPTTQILIAFQPPANRLFASDLRVSEPNRLLIQIQPAEGIRLSFLTKVPGSDTKLRSSELVYSFADDKTPPMSAYERLLLDAFDGDATLFARNDEIDAAWRIIDPFIETQKNAPLSRYRLGGWGPNESSDWIAADHRRWFDICPVLTRK